ncbi:hypothetical protein GCM10010448_11000 [Streptomyces glomeratus]|uniref:N-acetyltransferase domain-containing protein n=1 Tax=Streptomyces glomeratus TaxID=284452 RepID=A0ABP6L6V2_9ACTN
MRAEGTSISDDREGVERLLDREPDALLLAEQDGGLAGTVIAGFDGWRCHPYRLAAHPDRRRHGIGSALLAAAEERFVRLGGRRGDAMVLLRNETAQHAWRAAGYAPEEHWRRSAGPPAARRRGGRRRDRPGRLQRHPDQRPQSVRHHRRPGRRPRRGDPPQVHGRAARLSEVTVRVPQVSELTFVGKNDARQMAWHLFVETATRGHPGGHPGVHPAPWP